MNFLSDLLIGHVYELRVAWGVEYGELSAISADALELRNPVRLSRVMVRKSEVLAYSEHLPSDNAPWKPCSVAVEEQGLIAEVVLPPKAHEPQTQTLTGVIKAFYGSPHPGSGFGYINAPEENTDNPEERKVYFFHASQIQEENLLRYLKQFPLPRVGENGKFPPVKLPFPLEVSFMLGDNRGRGSTHINRPVADHIRLTEQSRSKLASADITYEYVTSGVAYFSGCESNGETDGTLVMQQGEKQLPLAFSFSRIVDPLFKRYLAAAWPLVSDDLKFFADAFRVREGATGRCFYIAAQIRAGGEKPWTPQEEEAWLAEMSKEELASLHAPIEPASFQPADNGAPRMIYDDGARESAYYHILPPWNAPHAGAKQA
ncbi:MAG: hypothetical protein RSA65_02595 [Clostridia bacterium]